MDNKETNSIKLSVVNMSDYTAPKLVESYTENRYVSFGLNNSYFNYLNEAYNTSPTNRAVINSIGGMIYGKGIDFIGSDEKESLLKEIKKLLPAKDLRLIAMDFKTYAQCALQVGYNSDHSKIVKVKHQPIMTIAQGKMDKMGNVQKYWYSANWDDTNNYRPVSIPAFGTSKKQVELLYIQNYTYSSGLMYYSNVDYKAGLQYCTMEKEVSNFHLNNILNGFNPGMLLTFKDGKPDVKEQLMIEKKVKEKWGGSGNAGSIMIAFTDSDETAPTVETIELSKADKQYEFVSNEATDKILISHRVTSPLLLGIKDAAGFSSNADELKESYKLFNLTVINPFQEILIDGLQEILNFNGVVEDIYFIPLMPIDFVDEDIEKDEDVVEKETGVATDGVAKVEITKDETKTDED